jgi:copper chaperone
MPAMLRLKLRRALIEPAVTVLETRQLPGGAAATMQIDGLLCSLCASNVRRGLAGIDGVTKAQVSLDTGIAEIEYNPAPADRQALTAAVNRRIILRPLRRAIALVAKAFAGDRP